MYIYIYIYIYIQFVKQALFFVFCNIVAAHTHTDFLLVYTIIKLITIKLIKITKQFNCKIVKSIVY